MPSFAKATEDDVGKDGFEPPNSEEDRFTVCCRWPLGYLPVFGNTLAAFPAPISDTYLEPLVGIEPTTY